MRERKTSERAFSGSSVSVLVEKEMRRGRRQRAILWSAGAFWELRRRVRMQFAATFAVYQGISTVQNSMEVLQENIPCDHLDNQSPHPRILLQVVLMPSYSSCH